VNLNLYTHLRFKFYGNLGHYKEHGDSFGILEMKKRREEEMSRILLAYLGNYK